MLAGNKRQKQKTKKIQYTRLQSVKFNQWCAWKRAYDIAVKAKVEDVARHILTEAAFQEFLGELAAAERWDGNSPRRVNEASNIRLVWEWIRTHRKKWYHKYCINAHLDRLFVGVAVGSHANGSVTFLPSPNLECCEVANLSTYLL